MSQSLILRDFNRRIVWIFTLAVILSASIAGAEVRLASIFGDHMVLQQQSVLPVWGTASPGESITVSIAGNEATTVADEQGKWMVKLAPLPASSDPVELRVQGTNNITLHDVLLGDVWLASGQSNMEFPLPKANNAAEALADATDPQLRLFAVQRFMSFVPQQELKGVWLPCTPANIRKSGVGGFSAVGYFFGKEIRADRKVPIAIIESTWGGTSAEAWTSIEALRANSVLAHYADSFEKTRELLEQLKEDNPSLPPWQQPHDGWSPRDPWNQPYLEAYNKAVQQGNPLVVEAAVTAQKLHPKKPVFAGLDPEQPTVQFNGLIDPLIPFSIRGVIWYQGEGNAASKESCKEYATLFPAMIQDWRSRWGQAMPDLSGFPFIYVQLPGYDAWDWPQLRESQLKTLAVPNTGMAVTIDLGEEKNIHPTDKVDVGHRLALVARHLVYGEDLVYSGPIYQSMQIEDDKIRLKFNNVGSGLTISVSPANPSAAPAAALNGFEIGPDEYHITPAQASIDGDTVVVWSDSVPQPKIVRYAWAGFPKPAVNLYNKEGLPAAPFETQLDDLAAAVKGNGHLP